ncbi:Long-chain-fatty-acid--AMP ligase FadD29 [Marinomonas spartinae]|uniref:AMP-binding protein n=1 Tax=Marinomonas spartinae TaxID=1792290 RepID=UPI0008090091|nr:AMP-binding protein [Marinomonas spartinae]SBS27165.1 Long-chain-fatty-acid--AMP ligase FadD29 [Marinomonas spartinae]
MESKSTFVSVTDALDNWAKCDGDRIAYRYHDDEKFREGVSYASLADYTSRLAYSLRKKLYPGDRVAILLTDSTAYILCFFGALKAGLIPVPLPRPNWSTGRNENKSDRFIHAIRDCTPALLILEPDDRARMAEINSGFDFEHVTFDELVSSDESAIDLNARFGDEVAFLQYTSGSTSAPKGVMLTHRNLLANHQTITELTKVSGQATLVSWLPLSHDMGMIGKITHTAYLGGTCHLIRPDTFIRNPFAWLKLISDYRAVGTVAPNFALDHCVKRIKVERLGELDLSSLKALLNGSEDIRAASLKKFAEKFEQAGFDLESFCSVYGLAEATLLVAGAAPRTPPVVVRGAQLSDSENFERGGHFISPQAEYVSCGQALSEHRIRIVDPLTRKELTAGNIGEIWFSGPSVTLGYWNDSEKTREVFDNETFNDGLGPYLRTGDLGVVFDGSLFIAGRLKDVIIYNGKNYYPSDIERIVISTDLSLQEHNSAAISVFVSGVEKLVLLQEVHPRDLLNETFVLDLKHRISRAVSQNIQIPIKGVYLLARGTLPKTTSGKVSRSQSKKLFIDQLRDSPQHNYTYPEHLADGINQESDFFSDKTIQNLDVVEKTTVASYHRIIKEIEEWIISWIIVNKEVSRTDISFTTPFAELGLDSIDAVSIIEDFNCRYRASIDVTVLFNYPTLEELIPHLSLSLRNNSK